MHTYIATLFICIICSGIYLNKPSKLRLHMHMGGSMKLAGGLYMAYTRDLTTPARQSLIPSSNKFSKRIAT